MNRKHNNPPISLELEPLKAKILLSVLKSAEEVLKKDWVGVMSMPTKDLQGTSRAQLTQDKLSGLLAIQGVVEDLECQIGVEK